MNHTQIELTAPSGKTEVWWLPVPEKKAKVGEKITRQWDSKRDLLPKTPAQDWTITQVCVTLPEDVIPIGARIARCFQREASTLAYMSF